MTPQPSEQPDPREQVARWLRSRYGMLRNYSVPEMIMGLDIALSEAGVRLAPVEAAAPDPTASPLDVERLAKALHEVLCITQPTQPPRERLWHVQEAKDIAAAYESLGQPVAQDSDAP